MVPPPHIYRLEGRRGSQGGAPSRRNPTWVPLHSGQALSPIPIRSRKGRGGRGNPIPFFLSSFPFSTPIWPDHMGGRTSPFVAGVFPLLVHKAHIACRGCPEPLPVTRYVPGTPRTLPVLEYYRPIYESLPIDHFETPRHVRDLIRDSEQHSVTNIHNSNITISSTNVKRVDPKGSRTM